MTGPSLVNVTCMEVRNRPVATVAPSAAQLADDGVDQWFGVLGAGGGDPRRAPATRRVAVQRELADDQQRRVEVGGGQVHHPLLVVEHPQPPELLGHPPGDVGVVVVGDPEQHAQARADPSDLVLADRHGS